MIDTQSIKEWIVAHSDEMFELLKDLCLIPAPSHHEEQRAAYCKEWLEKNGAKGVVIDSALNVLFPLNCEGSSDITVFVAHTDTVFPDTEPMPYSDVDGIVRCPGVGDDTASLAVMMMMAKYYLEIGYTPKGGILFVANSCEEGLGNLKGTRQFFEDYKGRIARFVSFDSNISIVNERCVGSHRYEVEVRTQGGHSYQAFGIPNAINELSGIVREIYSIDLPRKEGCRVTYNVGDISGGTSVNTIAQSARMLCEYRSDDLSLLSFMEGEFARIFEGAKKEGVEVLVKRIGDRPCAAEIDPVAFAALRDTCTAALTDTVDVTPTYRSASTDCNIPLSLGIPAICIGVYVGGGSHTREEWVEKASMIPGLEIAIKVGFGLTEK